MEFNVYNMNHLELEEAKRKLDLYYKRVDKFHLIEMKAKSLIKECRNYTRPHNPEALCKLTAIARKSELVVMDFSRKINQLNHFFELK